MDREAVIESLQELRREKFFELTAIDKKGGTASKEFDKCFREYYSLHMAIKLLKDGSTDGEKEAGCAQDDVSRILRS